MASELADAMHGMALAPPQQQQPQQPGLRKQKSQRFTVPTMPSHLFRTDTSSFTPSPYATDLSSYPLPGLPGDSTNLQLDDLDTSDNSFSSIPRGGGEDYASTYSAGSEQGGVEYPSAITLTQQGYNPYAAPGTYNSAPRNPGGSQRSNVGSYFRPPMPDQWAPPGTVPQQQQQPPQPLPPQPPQGQQQSGYALLMGGGNASHHPASTSSSFLPPSHQQPGQQQQDDIIPNAIVIKNIPFHIPREALLGCMESLGLPAPFAFNYHYEGNKFRGLAFANFRRDEEAAMVVTGLNGYDLQGRKLRAEYKKVLQSHEKERIEREKAIKRIRSQQFSAQHQQDGAFLGGGGDFLGPPQGWNRREASAPGGYYSAAQQQHQQQPEEELVRPPRGAYASEGGGYYHHPPAQHQQQQQQQRFSPPSAVGSTYSAAPSFPPFDPPIEVGGGGLGADGGRDYHLSPGGSPPSDVGTSVSARVPYSGYGGAGGYGLAPSSQQQQGGEAMSRGPSNTSSTAALSSSSALDDVDLNDPETLAIYERVLLFRDDPLRDELAFARVLSPQMRRIVHAVARRLGLEHASEGRGEDRKVVVFKGRGGEEQHRSLRHASSTRSFTSSPGASFHAPAPDYGVPPVPTIPTSHQQQQANHLSPPASSILSKKSMPDLRPPAREYDTTPLSARRSNVNLRSGGSSPVGTRRAAVKEQQQQQMSSREGVAVRQPRGPQDSGGAGFGR